MKDPSVVSTLEMAQIKPGDLAASDLLSLTATVVGGTSSTDILQRLTEFLAHRLESTECACLLVDSSAHSRDLIYAADAYHPELRGRRLTERALSYEVQAVLDRGLEWAHEHEDDESAPADDALFEDISPPVLLGALTETEARSAESVAGLIVPLFFARRVVAIQWIGARRDAEPFADWDVALAQCAGALAGQAVGAVLGERERLQDERVRNLEHQRQLEKLELTNTKLREVIESRSQELSICAHDMRAPIGVIQGHVSILRNLTKASGAQRKSLDAIYRQTRRLLGLVDDLLEDKRQRAIGLRLEPCDLSQLLSSWVEDFQLLSQRADVVLEADIPRDLGIRRIDSGKVLEIVLNLVDNAIKFSGAGGHVWLTASLPEEEELRLAVSDSGPGLSPEALESGFELFYRDPEAEEVGGSGVGLASVVQYVKLLGGHVEARNLEGAGAEFTVTLPAYLDELAADDTNPVPLQSFRVLVIDPDRDSLYATANVLSQQFEVLTARSLREAHWLLQQTPIDCAVIELNVPLMTGFATAVELRKDPARAHLPVLFTAATDPGSLTLRRRGGQLEDVVIKPAAPDDLVRRVTETVNESLRRASLVLSTHRDPLTGLITRKPAQAEIARQIERTRNKRSFLTLILVAVDQLAEVRTSQGDENAETLLKQFADTLLKVTRSQELASRWAEDEFLCILPTASSASGKVAAERIRDRLNRCRAGAAQSTVSLGVATAAARDEVDAKTLLGRARTALTSARERGGNQVVPWRKGHDLVESPQQTRRHVLIVCNDPELMKSLAEHFSQETELAVETAHSLVEAMNKARRTPPHAAILDLRLPDGTGFELLRRLRETGDPDLPVIAYTGQTDLATIDQTEEAGFNACFTTSARLEHLVEEVNRWLH